MACEALTLTVDSTIHNESASIGDSLGFLGVTAFVVIGQTNGLAPSTTRTISVVIVLETLKYSP